MKKYFLLLIPVFAFAHVIPHEELPSFGKAGATLTGLATAGLGAKQYEVWRSSLAPGGRTPLHTHDTEEIFIFLSGEGEVSIGGIKTSFKAPCTVICPAHTAHQFFNTGEEATDQIVVLGIGSEIVDANNHIMDLPWRE